VAIGLKCWRTRAGHAYAVYRAPCLFNTDVNPYGPYLFHRPSSFVLICLVNEFSGTMQRKGQLNHKAGVSQASSAPIRVFNVSHTRTATQKSSKKKTKPATPSYETQNRRWKAVQEYLKPLQKPGIEGPPFLYFSDDTTSMDRIVSACYYRDVDPRPFFLLAVEDLNNGENVSCRLRRWLFYSPLTDPGTPGALSMVQRVQ
jgi:hypothetical protein